jgi:hypothetical protein
MTTDSISITALISRAPCSSRNDHHRSIATAKYRFGSGYSARNSYSALAVDYVWELWILPLSELSIKLHLIIHGMSLNRHCVAMSTIILYLSVLLFDSIADQFQPIRPFLIHDRSESLLKFAQCQSVSACLRSPSSPRSHSPLERPLANFRILYFMCHVQTSS